MGSNGIFHVPLGYWYIDYIADDSRFLMAEMPPVDGLSPLAMTEIAMDEDIDHSMSIPWQSRSVNLSILMGSEWCSTDLICFNGLNLLNQLYNQKLH